MPTINMHAAKSQLSNLVKRAHAGEDVVIARDGRPVVRLVRVDQELAARQFGDRKSVV